MSSLRGKVALITGASSGIGAETARHFARLGCRLALTGRKLDNLQAVAKECEETGLAKDQIFLAVGNLAKTEDCKEVFSKAVEHFGQLDVLVNNAGMGVPGTLEGTSLEQYDEMMDINCRAMFHLSHLAVPHLLKTKGTIVNVSSVNGMRSFPGVLAYCMSKAAVDQMTRCSAIELAKQGVRVNAVNPGVIITNCHTRGGMSQDQYAKFLEHSKTTHAMGRVGTVDEVAKAISFLASDDSSFITGATLPIDGGRHALCPR